MIAQFGQLAQQNNRQNVNKTGSHNAVSIDEFVQYVQHRQTGGRTEQQGGNNRHGNACNHRCADTADVHFVLNRGHNHFNDRNHGSYPREHQRAEEQHTDQRAHRGLVDDGRERDKRQADTAGRHFADFFACGLSHKAQCGKYADTGEQLKAAVGKADNQACAAQVGFFLQVRRISNHDAEADGEREEDLAICGYPDFRIRQTAPVRRKQSVQTFCRTRQGQGDAHHDDKHHHQQRHEECGRTGYAFLHAQSHNCQRKHPNGNQRAGHFADKVQAQVFGIGHLQEVFEEECLRIRTPCRSERIIGIACRPANNHGVIDTDDDVGQEVPPTHRLKPTAKTAEGQRWRAAVTVADGIVEQQQRNTCRQQCNQIRKDESTAAVVEGDVRETPNVA